MHDVFKREVRVRYVHTDSIGVTFFANYLVFFDDILIEFFRDRDLVFAPGGENIVSGKVRSNECWFIGEAKCRYSAPSTYDDVLEISVMIREIKGKKVIFNLRCYNKTTESLSAEGSITMVYFDKKRGCSVTIPDDVIKLLQ